jgi:hypothetical protein
MKRIITILAFISVISACVSTPTIDMKQVMQEAMEITEHTNLRTLNIPSHGSIADAASIAVDGGGAANQLRESIEQLNNTGGGNLLVTSSNPALPNAHIRGAMKDLSVKIDNVLLIYAGKKEYSDLIKAEVEAKGIKYAFIDTYK